MLPAFESATVKSRANLPKHGIDFGAAQALWLDDELLQVAARTEDEPRFVVVGRIGDKVWSAVITYRGEAVRIISVRRAREAEVRAYESE